MLEATSFILIIFFAAGCHLKKANSDGSKDVQKIENKFRGYTSLGQEYSCEDNDYYSLVDESCASSDEIAAFIKSCSSAGHQVSRCGCVSLCSSIIYAACTEEARIDCIKNENGTYQTIGVGRSGFACAFPPVPKNAVDSKFCN